MVIKSRNDERSQIQNACHRLADSLALFGLAAFTAFEAALQERRVVSKQINTGPHDRCKENEAVDPGLPVVECPGGQKEHEPQDHRKQCRLYQSLRGETAQVFTPDFAAVTMGASFEHCTDCPGCK